MMVMVREPKQGLPKGGDTLLKVGPFSILGHSPQCFSLRANTPPPTCHGSREE